MARVLLDNVTKVFDGGVQAVSNATVDIKDREFCILVGPSGCGKSTTLRMIAGLEEITSGNITIGDQVVNDLPPKDRDIAMVFQNYALYPHMSVYDNMAFGLKIRKYPKEEIKRRVTEAAQILNIEQLLDRKPKALSGGQRQRVAVGRAIVRKPKVFLFDEPLSNLDAKLRVQMRAEISRLHSSLQATMIYVTHDQIEAMTMGDRIVVMRDGIIQQIGNPLELYNNPENRFVAGFIGSPPMNFANVMVSQSGDDIILDEGDFQIKVNDNQKAPLKPYIGKEVVMGIRPEDVGYVQSASKAKIKMKVDVVEPLGSEILLYTSTKSCQMVCRVDPDKTFKVNDEVELEANINKLKIFDMETEQTLI